MPTVRSELEAENDRARQDGHALRDGQRSDIDWNDSDDPIVVTIKNTIYVSNELTAQEQKDVEAHERQHFCRFQKARGTDEGRHRAGPEERSADRGPRRLAHLRSLPDISRL